jgi:hypothetical protein
MSVWLSKVTTIVASAFLAVALLAAPARADTLEVFTASLNGAQENPPVASPSTGVAVMYFNKDNSELCYRISYTPLGGTEVLAHFHGPAGPGQNAPVVKDISPSPPGPSPLGSPKHGCVTLDKQQVKDLKKGLWYINVHSTPLAPGGEIRGQVFPLKGVKYSKVDPLASPSGAFLD